jgi:putative zinc finger/helix-turn-helix YgiT family protein
MSVQGTSKRNANGQEVLCPQCGTANLETVEVEEAFDYGGRKEPIHVTALLPIKHCRKCDFSFEDWHTENARHGAACAQVGVQTPEEIRSIRRASGLSQREFARLTRLGGATLNRWERGHLIQNGAYDDYLYLLRYPENLERLKKRRHDKQELGKKGGPSMAFWIFKGNVDYYDHERRLADARFRPRMTWTVRHHIKEIKEGDTAFLWVKKGPRRGIRAVMVVEEEPTEQREWESEQEYWRKRDTETTWRIIARLTHPNVHLSVRTLQENGITLGRGTPCQLDQAAGQRVMELVEHPSTS